MLWAAVAGVAFGLFQAANRRGGMHLDAYRSTFVLLLAATVGVAVVSALTQDLGAARAAPASAFGWFALGGVVHFFIGWTLLALTQRRLGAARAGVVVGTTPLFGTAVALLALQETVHAGVLAGVVLVVAGIVLLSTARARSGVVPLQPAGFVLGFLAATCWASSPVFIRWGLEQLPMPLIGVTIGMTAATAAYGMALLVPGLPTSGRFSGSGVRWLMAAGAFVGFGIAGQWIALALAPVAVVLALNQLAVPVVVVTSPLIVGKVVEPFSARTAAGGAIVLAGTLVIIVSRVAGG